MFSTRNPFVLSNRRLFFSFLRISSVPSSSGICSTEIRSIQAACSETSPQLFSAWFARVVSGIYSTEYSVLGQLSTKPCVFARSIPLPVIVGLIMDIPCVIYSAIVYHGLRLEGRFKDTRDRVKPKLKFKQSIETQQITYYPSH